MITIKLATSKEEFFRRLKENVDIHYRAILFNRSNRPFFGRVTGDRFWIESDHRIPFLEYISIDGRGTGNNAFAPVFFGQIKESVSGVELVGRFSVRLSVKIFMALLFVFLSFIAVMSLIRAIDDIFFDRGVVSERDWLKFVFVIAPVAMASLFYFLIRLGQRMSRHEKDEITALLHQLAAGEGSRG